MIIRVKFTKTGYLKYISHLDLMRLFRRVFKRACIPVAYSRGYNPQPKFSIANPLPLGIESLEEYMDIDLDNKIPVGKFIEDMNKELPEGITISHAQYIGDNKSISSLISWGFYEIKFETDELEDEEELQYLLNKWLKNDEIIIQKTRYRRGKTSIREEDIRPYIGNVIIKGFERGHNSNGRSLTTLECLLKAGDRGNLRPMDFIEALVEKTNMEIDMLTVDIKRLRLLAEKNGEIIWLM